MKNIFNIGDRKVHLKIVETTDLASFKSTMVHPFCSTFVLAREMEWASRLFVLEMLEDDEEGIGTKLEINHLSPALQGEELTIEATISSLNEHEIVCEIEVSVGDRKIASGITGQKILKKTKLANMILNIQQHGRKEE
jgi:fluoroacetyl-CoA thioesterase